MGIPYDAFCAATTHAGFPSTRDDGLKLRIPMIRIRMSENRKAQM